MKKIILLLLFLSSSVLANTQIKLTDYYGIGVIGGNEDITLTTVKPEIRSGVFGKLDSTINLKNKTIKLKVKSSDWNNTKEFSMLFGTNGFVNNTSFNIKEHVVNPTDNEWIDIVVPINNWTKEGNPDLENINYVMWRSVDVDQRITTQVDGFEIIPEGNKSFLSITIDDGEETGMIAHQIMSKYGLRGGIYIDEKVIGTPTWFNQRQLTEFAKSGWDISGHEILERIPSISKSGPYEKYAGEYLNNVNQLSSSEMDKIISDTHNYLKKNKYKGSNIFAYPNGIRSQKMIESVKRNFKYGLNIDALDNPTNFISSYDINRRSINKTTSVEQIKEWIDSSKQNYLWIVLNFHTFDVDSTKDINYLPKDFDEVCKYAKNSGVNVLPISEVIDTITTTKKIQKYQFLR